MLFGLISLSCNKTSSNEHIKYAESDFKVISVLPESKVNISDFGKNLEYVVLETKPGYIIASLDKVKVQDDRIFILSKTQKTIFIFSLAGDAIGKISDFGDGPGKYPGISDFDVQNDCIWLLTSPSKSVFKYDFSGNLLEIKSTNGNYMRELISLDSTYVAHLVDAFDYQNKFNIVEWDSEFSNRINQFLYIDKDRRNNPQIVENYIAKSDSSIFIVENFSNLIYVFKNKELLINFEITINGRGVPLDYMKKFKSNTNKAVKASIDEDLFTGFRKIISSNSFLFLELMKGDEIIRSFISLKSGESISFKTFGFDFDFGLAGEVIGAKNDKFIMLVPENIMNDLKQLDIDGKINEENLKNNQLRKVIKSYEKEGNPVLVFFDVDVNSGLWK